MSFFFLLVYVYNQMVAITKKLNTPTFNQPSFLIVSEKNLGTVIGDH